MKGYAMLRIGATGWIEKERPVCGPLDAIVRPLALSPCTSDVHTVWEGALGDRHNMILGHEGCGVVDEVGSLVKDFKKGDRVMVAAITPDWSSLEAQAGFCAHSGGMLAGWKFSNFKDGVFGEYFHVNDADGNLAHMPDKISPEEACMLSDMVPTGFHGVEQADVQFGDTVLVIGIGPVGLMAVAGANLHGAGRIICVGTRKVCREAAAAYGATDFIGYKEGSIDEQVLRLTDGKGVDKVIIAGHQMSESRRPHRQRQLPGQRRLHHDSPGRVGLRHGQQGHLRRSDARGTPASGKAGQPHRPRQAGRQKAHHAPLPGL